MRNLLRSPQRISYHKPTVPFSVRCSHELKKARFQSQGPGVHQNQDASSPLQLEVNLIVDTAAALILQCLHDLLEVLELLGPLLLLLLRMLVGMVFQSLLPEHFLQLGLIDVRLHAQLFIESRHQAGERQIEPCESGFNARAHLAASALSSDCIHIFLYVYTYI